MNDSALAGNANDLMALIFVGMLIAGYQTYLRALTRRNAGIVLSHVAMLARTAWVEAMMADRSNGLLAIQTLRNTTMAATFLASTAILLMVGVLTLSGQAAALEKTWHFLNVFGALTPQIWLIKLLCLLSLLFFAFLCFSNAIRVLNHVGYMINTQKSSGEMQFLPMQVAGELNRGGYYFSLGMRSFYYLAPLVCWLFGPLYMVLATVVLVGVVLPRIDKMPTVSADTKE